MSYVSEATTHRTSERLRSSKKYTSLLFPGGPKFVPVFFSKGNPIVFYVVECEMGVRESTDGKNTRFFRFEFYAGWTGML